MATSTFQTDAGICTQDPHQKAVHTFKTCMGELTASRRVQTLTSTIVGGQNDRDKKTTRVFCANWTAVADLWTSACGNTGSIDFTLCDSTNQAAARAEMVTNLQGSKEYKTQTTEKSNIDDTFEMTTRPKLSSTVASYKKAELTTNASDMNRTKAMTAKGKSISKI
ncbi:hypothetical protein BDB00DRAFT_880643 [Zychaea mexicana]|uniref:uncharacterized protein n=1 Tax=Zychaea mexicana TaxID=64656 RepID=UPI0022FE7891|nr:uncharacterized protein BDB00DRAFT_880643 [Zychaea mexicana]KAI9466455.1 hypothetical protein BDB00DRAFT_880643 [Zychaea mexicana]